MSRTAQVYPVEITKPMKDAFGKDNTKRYTVFVKSNKSAIIKKLKSLGISNYKINQPVSKAMLSKVNVGSLSDIKKPPTRFAGAGKTAGGVNNPGMKLSSEASATKTTNKKQKPSTGSGSNKKSTTVTTKKKPTNVRGGSLKADKTVPPKSKDVKSLTADKKESIVKKVKSKNKNVPKSRILSWIKNNPVKAGAGGAGIVGLIIGALGYALTPTPAADATLNVTTSSKGKRPKSRITKPSSTSDTKGPRPKSRITKPSSTSSTKGPRPKSRITKPSSTSSKQDTKTASSFGEAFRQAKNEGKQSFTFKGKSYATVTKDEVKKAGHSTLQSYLNAKGKPKKLTSAIKNR